MGRRFVAERRRDPYYKAAQAEGLRSRSAFKLRYLAQKFPIFVRGGRVLDLGAAPGGWSLVALESVGPSGSVTAVDPRSIEPAPGIEVIHGTVGEPDLANRLSGRRFDAVLSDMSPRISGAYATDHARSVALVRAGFGLARDVLAPGGSFVAKLFDGDLRAAAEAEIAPAFAAFHRTKPPASREPSSELYLVALRFRGGTREAGRRPRAPALGGAGSNGSPQ